MSKRKKFFILYAIFIFVALIYILFFADSKYFVQKEKDNNTSSSTKVTKTLPTIEEQKENLLKESYEYHYDLNHNGVSYECSGKKEEEKNTGICENKDIKIEYNEENYQEKLKDLDYNYLDVNYIFNEIKDIEPENNTLQKNYYYKYNVNIGKLPGEISIHSDSEKITQITIANGYLVYVLYFDRAK